MLIRYVRVSTEDQDTDLQVTALLEAGYRRIYIERASRKKLQRAEWRLCKMDLREGDTLVKRNLDCLVHSVIDLSRVSQEFLQEGIELVVLTQNIDARTPSGRILSNILAAVSEMERDPGNERTKAGMTPRRAEGARQRSLSAITPAIWKTACAKIQEHEFAISPYRLCDKVKKRPGTRLSKLTVFKWRERPFVVGNESPEDWKCRLKQHDFGIGKSLIMKYIINASEYFQYSDFTECFIILLFLIICCCLRVFINNVASIFGRYRRARERLEALKLLYEIEIRRKNNVLVVLSLDETLNEYPHLNDPNHCVTPSVTSLIGAGIYFIKSCYVFCDFRNYFII